ncbi:hypothetical protein JW777_01790 [bacterium]|nr:hypothetical protein [bacterium]
MNLKRTLSIGIPSGISMTLGLFIGGAVFAHIIYGPEFAPPGKFKAEQMNPFYFLWTKAAIGVFFGILFTLFYEVLPLSRKIRGAWQGMKYGFLFWLVLTAWDISHPLVYDSIRNDDQLFWLVYSLTGFLAYGLAAGYLYKREEVQAKPR